MAIINPLPYTIANGNPVDATPVESNFSQIVSNVNANAALVGGNASQEFLVATTANPAGAIPLAQANGAYAPIAGNSSQVFAVASGTGADAVPYTQLQSYVSANAAPVNGSTGNVFNVAAATEATNAVQLQQIIGANNGAAPASISLGTRYTNNTGRVLLVFGYVQANVSAGAALSVSGHLLQGSTDTLVCNFYLVNTGTSTQFMSTSVFFAVPPGMDYSVNSSGTGFLFVY